MQRTARVLTGLVSAALATGGAVAVAPSSEAAPATAAAVKAPIDCPTAYPISKVTKGLKGTGFTVETGSTPAPLTATIMGRVTNGLAPGVDLIVAKISSPAITRAHGIWAGISGSPVYASDGRLIGSISYGLGTNSDVAGLTPAAAVLSVLAGPPSASAKAAARPARVLLTEAQKRELAAAGAAQAVSSSGFSRVPVPVTVSGKPSKRVLDYLNSLPDVRVVTGGGRSSGATGKASAVHAGGNFVAALSYGDYTVAAAGTTTAVCKGKAVAFGHPFLGVGPVSLTAHTGTAVEVQTDSLFGAYKIVNPGAVVGVVDEDLNHGIRAVLGAKPSQQAVVTTSVTVGSHKPVKGSTTVLYPRAVGGIAANHVMADLVGAIGYEGPGSAKATFVVKGVRAGGKAFTLTRTNVYGDSTDLPNAVADSLYQFTEPLVEQEFEDARITSIAVTASVQSAVHRYSVARVEANEGGHWTALGKGPLPVTPGTTLGLRAVLTPYKGIGATKVVSLDLAVPAGVGANLGLSLTAGDIGVDTSSAGSLTELLELLAAAPATDSVRAQLIDFDSQATIASHSVRVGTAIAPFTNNYAVVTPGSGGPGA